MVLAELAGFLSAIYFTPTMCFAGLLAGTEALWRERQEEARFFNTGSGELGFGSVPDKSLNLSVGPADTVCGFSRRLPSALREEVSGSMKGGDDLVLRRAKEWAAALLGPVDSPSPLAPHTLSGSPRNQGDRCRR